MKKEAEGRMTPPQASSKDTAQVASHFSAALLDHITIPIMVVDPQLNVIGVNAACEQMLTELCGRDVAIGDSIATLPLEIETASHDGGTLGSYCLRAFSTEPFYVAGHCVGSMQARSVLLKFTPVLDAFSQPLMLHISIQEFPDDSPANEPHFDHDAGLSSPLCEAAVANLPQKEYRLSFEAAPVGIAHVAPDGHILRANRALCEMLGYTCDEVVSMSYQTVTHPADLEADKALVAEVLDGKRSSYVLEKRYLHKSGSTIWAYLAATLLRDDAGEPKYFISVVTSIHTRKAALMKIEESRGRLRAVFDSLREAVFVFNARGKLVDANPAALQMFAYQNIEEAGFNVETLDQRFEARTLDAGLLPLSDWPISRILRGERVRNVELRITQRSSGKSWIASFSGSRTPAHGDVPALAVLTIRDITKRHYAELALRQSEQRFRTAFDHIPDMVVLYDRDLRIRYVNHAMLETAQRSASSLIGLADSELHGFPMADLRRSLLLACLQTGHVQKGDCEFPSPRGTRHVTASCVPLLDAKGRTEEIMCLYHDFTERRHAEERALQAALHDPLTRLPNRALLFEYAKHVLGGAGRMKENVLVLFIDLDRFKPINDLHGHETGDDVLHQVAQRISNAIREEDMVFRLGGDEFLVLMPRIREIEAARLMATQLLKAIARHYQVGPLRLSLSASIGISLYPQHGEQIDTLINHADAAMYYAKQQGRDRYQFYEGWMSDHASRQAVIELELRHAIENNAFSLCYQPVIDIHARRIVSVEALIRWPGNNTSADHFVPVAEATGLIGAVGDWVLAEACRQYRSWHAEGMLSVPIAINVSPVQFRRHDLADHIEACLRQYGLDGSAIQIELTETAVMDDIDRAIDVLWRLRGHGIRIALDDFGTGYSSLNYLSRLPLDKLKIDQTFVQRIDSDSAGRAITEAIIVLGRTLGLTVVAEGIESEQIWRYLCERGCHEAQGYFICKPLSGKNLSAWVRENGLHDKPWKPPARRDES